MKLPVELVSEILRDFGAHDILTLMTVSRDFYGVCGKKLYTKILLKDLGRTQKCLETLAFNLTLAGSVRAFSIRSLHQSVAPSTLSQFTRTLRSALRNIAPGVVSLELGILDLDPSSHMNRMHCPWLRALLVTCPFGPDIVNFVLAHPHIENLAILGSFKGRGNRTSTKNTPISLPKLRHLLAPSDSMPIFLSGSRPTTVEMTFGPDSHWVSEQQLVHLLSQHHTSITSLGLAVSTIPHLSLFNVVGKGFNQLTKLKLPFYSIIQSLAVHDGLNVVLPNMPNLYHLHIYPTTNESLDPDSFSLQNLTDVHTMLTGWSALQESLCICEMPSRLPWARLKTSGYWIPIIPIEVVVKWWMSRTSLLVPLQENILSTIFKTGVFDIPQAVPDLFSDQGDGDAPYSKCARKLALAVGYVINRAFNIQPTDPSATEQDAQLFLEQLLVPVHDPDGEQLEAYSRPPCQRKLVEHRSQDLRWDLVLTLLALVALHPVEVTMLDLGMQHNLPSAGIIPTLNDWQKEHCQLLLDVAYNCSDGMDGVKMSNYLRNPNNFWGEDRIVVVFDQGAIMSPVELPTSLQDWYSLH